jgi:hypothetical protein
VGCLFETRSCPFAFGLDSLRRCAGHYTVYTFPGRMRSGCQSCLRPHFRHGRSALCLCSIVLGASRSGLQIAMPCIASKTPSFLSLRSFLSAKSVPRGTRPFRQHSSATFDCGVECGCGDVIGKGCRMFHTTEFFDFDEPRTIWIRLAPGDLSCSAPGLASNARWAASVIGLYLTSCARS